jgi:hypothetical protein
MKFGYQGGFSTPTKNYYYDSTVIQVRTNNGVPNQITQNLAYPGWLRTGRHVIPVNFYGQDQWTMKRLTLQGGVRFDHGITNYTSDRIGGPDYILMPTQVSFPTGSTQGIDWKDITPRGAWPTTCSGTARPPSRRASASTWKVSAHSSDWT